MKKMIYILMILSVMIMTVSAYDRNPSVELRNGTMFDVNLLTDNFVNQDPDPAEPGSYVDLRWKIENTGDNPAENVVVELIPLYPFSLDPNEEAVKEIGTLLGEQTGEEGVIVKYKVRVDRNAVEGENDIKIRTRHGTSGWVTDTYKVNVQTRDASLNIEKVETIPENLVPGKKAVMRIYMKNIADSTIKDVTLKLDLALSTVTIPATAATASGQLYSDLIPFAPLNSATEKKIRYIEPGKEGVFEYELMVYPDASSKVYKIPIVLTYYDELDSMTTKNDMLGVRVGGEPDLEVVVDSQEIYQSGGRGDVIFKFVNKGTNDIKFLNVKVLESDDYELFGPDSTYIGDVDSDDYETLPLNLYVRDSEDGYLTVLMELTYTDSNNEEYSDYVESKVRMYNAMEMKQFGLSQSSAGTGIFIVIVIVVVGFFGYRYYKKRKAKKNNNKKKK